MIEIGEVERDHVPIDIITSINFNTSKTLELENLMNTQTLAMENYKKLMTIELAKMKNGAGFVFMMLFYYVGPFIIDTSLYYQDLQNQNTTTSQSPTSTTQDKTLSNRCGIEYEFYVLASFWHTCLCFIALGCVAHDTRYNGGKYGLKFYLFLRLLLLACVVFIGLVFWIPIKYQHSCPSDSTFLYFAFFTQISLVFGPFFTIIVQFPFQFM